MKANFMYGLRSFNLFVLMVGALLAGTEPGARAANFTVDSYQIVSSTRISRTTFEYVVKPKIKSNLSYGVTQVHGSVASTSASTVILQGAADFGAIAAGSMASSIDTIKVRQDLSTAFNPSMLVWTFTFTIPPPTVAISSPSDGAHTPNPTIVVNGTYGGTTLSVDVNALLATLNQGSFSVSAPLSFGANTITATARGPNNLSASTSITVYRDPPPTLQIASPANNAHTSAASILVSGSFTGPLTSLDVNGVSATLETSTFSALVPLQIGPNTITASAFGPGGSGQKTITVTRDPGPTIHIASPATGSHAGTDSILVSGTFTGTADSIAVNGIDAAISASTFSATVPLQIGANSITALITGPGGSASDSINVTRDAPPQIQITSPADNAQSRLESIAISGTLGGGRVDSVSVNGVAATINGLAFTATIPLQIGDNTITATANGPGGSAQSAITVHRDYPLPVVTITSPTSLALLNTPTITVAGTVDMPNAFITVNGVSATVAGLAFSAPVTLREGNNVITALALSEHDQVGSSSLQVTLDTSPPRISINSPSDGAILSDPQVTVTGIINDTVVGTVNGDQATVKVNGVATEVANRTFVAMNLPLVPGQNTITAVGTDKAGNSASVSITVTYNTAPAARIKVVSGDSQSGRIGDLLADPLIVKAIDQDGNPVSDKNIIFKVTENDGVITGGGNTARSLIVKSGADGQAQVQFRLGTRAGAGNNQVSASIVGFEGEATFRASATPSDPGLLVPDAGNNQVGLVSQALPSPLVTIVVDSGKNRLHNIPVTFTIKQGGGSFGGQPSITVNSDSDGRSLAILTLGPDPGNDNNVVEANFAGNTGAPVTFVASGRVAGDPAKTTISGVVLDNSDIPVPGVLMRILGMPDAVRSDENGFFKFTQAPIGGVRLIADGSTATRPGAWVWLQFDIVTIAGQDNDIGRPVRLLAMDLDHAIHVDETHGGVLTLPQAPGYSLSIAPNSVTFPDGTHSGNVSVTIVHPDKMPDPPSFGQQPRFLVSIQPANAIFNPPAAMCLPNLDGLPPGQKTDMYSYDHDMQRFVSIGTGTVSEDGLSICSDPGNGVVKGGWHCGGNPEEVARGLVTSVSVAPSDIVICKDEETTITATGSPQPPFENTPYSWTAGGNVTISDPEGDGTATIRGTKAGTEKSKVRYLCKSAQPAETEFNVTVVEVTIADVVRAPGIPNSLPPTKTYDVAVTITPALPAGQFVEFNIDNGGDADAGTASITSPANKRLTASGNLTIKGGTQTTPGHAGTLKIKGKLNGKDCGESKGFSVCAHLENWTDSFAGDIDEPARVGVIVQDGWSSDGGGTIAELDELEASEVVKYDAAVAPFIGGGAVNNSGYLAADALTTDTHTIGRNFDLTVAAVDAAHPYTWRRIQLTILKCKRCGGVDFPAKNGGLDITHRVWKDGAQWKHQTIKTGAAVTIGANSTGAASTTPATGVLSSVHDIP